MSFGDQLGQKLRATRFLLKLSLEDVSVKLSIAASTLLRVERGRPTTYDTGKAVEKWLKSQEIEICSQCQGTGYRKKEAQK